MQSRPLPLAEIATHFSASKATIYRRLVLLERSYPSKTERELFCGDRVG
jgi:hypothetical protein